MVGEQCARDVKGFFLEVLEEGLVLHVLDHHALNAERRIEQDELKAARWMQAALLGVQHELKAERWVQADLQGLHLQPNPSSRHKEAKASAVWS